jgi:hypothetical protein
MPIAAAPNCCSNERREAPFMSLPFAILVAFPFLPVRRVSMTAHPEAMTSAQFPPEINIPRTVSSAVPVLCLGDRSG